VTVNHWVGGSSPSRGANSEVRPGGAFQQRMIDTLPKALIATIVAIVAVGVVFALII
jgi:hypothetical protein